MSYQQIQIVFYLFFIFFLVSCKKDKPSPVTPICELKGITGKFYNVINEPTPYDTLLLVEKSDSVFADFYSDLDYKGTYTWSGMKTCDAILKLRIKQEGDFTFHKISLNEGIITDSLFSGGPTQVRYFKELK